MAQASRLSVLKGEPGCRGMSEGAATKQGTLSCLRRRAITARAGFIGHFQERSGMSFADPTQGLLQPVHIIGDGAEEADLAFGTGFSDSDGDGVFVDI